MRSISRFNTASSIEVKGKARKRLILALQNFAGFGKRAFNFL